MVSRRLHSLACSSTCTPEFGEPGYGYRCYCARGSARFPNLACTSHPCRLSVACPCSFMSCHCMSPIRFETQSLPCQPSNFVRSWTIWLCFSSED
ncbi:hypothetical protein FA13DRAFT_1091018 [Coprinellus micaceus]|uniref:Uncharacterized protein n=1 Tax=Coprinellus micaceus TaxID=71717 RepID=A0A4Y7TTK8_COPMI|nr:hypothetical protein FA13DRAFT_1091018 [Coprinellus micaceus]